MNNVQLFKIKANRIFTNSLMAVSCLAILALIPAATYAVTSDDFNQASINMSLWTPVDPIGDATFSAVGAGTGDAQLLISVPAGDSHDPWYLNEAARLMQSVADTDFEIEVKFDSLVSEKYQDQGVIVEENENDWLRFDTYSDGSRTRIFAASIVNGSPAVKISKVISTEAPVFLNVERTGDSWALSYSNDGFNWTVAGSFLHTMAVTAVGPYAGNFGSGSNAPAHTAVIDYFFNAADPIDPEDGAPITTYQLSASVVGSNGSITPTGGSYDEGEVVALTAIADTGYRVKSWSGTDDDSLTTATNTVTMDADKTVLVEFEPTSAVQYLLSANVVGGNGSIIPTGGSYDEGEVVTLSAIADTGYQVKSWSGTDDDSLTSATNTVTMDADKTVTVDFEEVGGIPDAPVISIWYGNEQTFGSIGNPQIWVNILGNVSDPDGISVLNYSLNGGLEFPLDIGPSNYRLKNPGDFNVEISTSDLIDGQNQVAIIANDGLGNESVEIVLLNYTSGNVWPETYTADWNNATSIQEVAQVVDGLWAIESGMVRVEEPGYDRLIAIGDLSWSNYEVKVEMIAHSLLPSSNPPALGVLTRWQGHVVDGHQPSRQWWPLGVFAHIRWYDSGPRLRMLANQTSIIASISNFQVDLNVPYTLKLRSETISGNTTYQLKVWKANETEPLDWTLAGEEIAEDQELGSLLLVAHNIDASFGRVEVTPLSQNQGQYSLSLNVSGGGSVTLDPPGGVYDEGTVVELTAIADVDWDFSSWSGDLNGVTNPEVLEMDSNKNVTANFISTGSVAFLSDDFNQSSIDTSLWTMVDPQGDATFSIVGAGTGDSQLLISVPAGDSHDPWRVNEAARLMQPAVDTDFEIEVKFDSIVSERYQDQGIIVEGSENNWLRFDTYSDGSRTRIFAASIVNGSPSVKISKVIPTATPTYLKVARSGNSWNLFYSNNGFNWTNAGSFTHVLAVTKVGPYGGNYDSGNNAPDHTAVIDYFFNTADPIVPEDG